MYAQALIDGKDKTPHAATATPVTQTVAYDVDLERQRLDFQRGQLIFERERVAREEQQREKQRLLKNSNVVKTLP